MPEDMPDRMPEDMPDRMPDRMPKDMSDRMPEDLPVTKCINVMVGITRSKDFFHFVGSALSQATKHDNTNRILHVYMCTTDQGSNEAWGRRAILCDVKDDKRTLFLDSDCLEHGPHLIVMASLILADQMLSELGRPWKYWKSLATFAYTSRDVAKKLYDAWVKRFGALDAKSRVKSLFPKPASQRWGRVHELESRIMRAGFLNLAVCLAEILTSKFVDMSEVAPLESCSSSDQGWEALSVIKSCIRCTKDKQQKQKKEIDAGKTSATPDVLSVEQTKAYTIQMSKWRGQTLVAIADRLWGKTIETMYHTREPIIHLTSFLKANSSSESDDCTTFGILAQLVHGKASEIQAEFDVIASNFPDSWAYFFLLFAWSGKLR